VIRTLKHLLLPDWIVMRAFSAADFKAVEDAIKASERQHEGELRFVVEAGLPFAFLRVPTRRRAEALFADLGVWDTAGNSGVLVYIELIDHRIEIVADRGIAARVAQADWEAICRTMESAFRQKKYREGALAAVGAITAILAKHFPPRGGNPNELPDKPVVL
jgi:uncharacterized membrane protein